MEREQHVKSKGKNSVSITLIFRQSDIRVSKLLYNNL